MIDTKALRRAASDAHVGHMSMELSGCEIIELLNRLEAWENVFGHLGTPDEVGNEWHSLSDRLEAAEKERDDVAQQLVQSEQGKRKISEECDTYKAAYNKWTAKTEWVQQGVNEGTISAKYLGLHRADVMTSLLGEAEKERDALRTEVESWKGLAQQFGNEADALRARIEQMEQQEPEWGLEARAD